MRTLLNVLTKYMKRNRVFLPLNSVKLATFLAVFLVSAAVMGAGCNSSTSTSTDTPSPTAQNDRMEGEGQTTDKGGTDISTSVSIDASSSVPGVSVTGDVMVAKPTSARYKDGTYAVTGVYNSPAGAEEIGVSVTLKKDLITDASVTAKATNPKSQYFQGQFVSGYKQYVVGKNIADVKVGRVSGSSLTPQGFNDAVAKIKAQAAL